MKGMIIMERPKIDKNNVIYVDVDELFPNQNVNVVLQKEEKRNERTVNKERVSHNPQRR